jgi:hypothetical protein
MELVVAWRMKDEEPVQGITVFRIPEALHAPVRRKTEE